MDVCSLSRPFDDLTQDKIYLEAEAVLSIVSRCETDDWTLIGSGIIEYELSNISDEEKFEQVQSIYSVTNERIALTMQAEERAKHFQKNGIKPLDSLHLALAEAYNVDVFLTTDNHFLDKANQLNVKIKTANPVTWLMEVINNES